MRLVSGSSLSMRLLARCRGCGPESLTNGSLPSDLSDFRPPERGPNALVTCDLRRGTSPSRFGFLSGSTNMSGGLHYDQTDSAAGSVMAADRVTDQHDARRGDAAVQETGGPHARRARDRGGVPGVPAGAAV